MKKIISTCLMLTVLGACSTKAPEDPGKASPPKTPKIVGSADAAGTSFDAKQLANEMESNFVYEIRFKKNSAEVPDEAKRALAGLIASAKKQDSLKKAKLITWADSEMPTEEKESLPDAQVELAKKRNEALTKYIQTIEGGVEIDPISMAERPQGLKNLIPNEAARIQESLEAAGIPEKGEKKEGLGKASRSIVIFTRE